MCGKYMYTDFIFTLDINCMIVGAVAALRGVAEKEAASVLFWEHIIALASIAMWLIVYLNIIF